ncbi:MAG: glycine oxidase ThiO [Woeseiaceae bacterium]
MSDILIIGGGIIGMLTARELSLSGMKVTIIEQAISGQESSWAGGGIISPLYPWRYSDAVSALASWGQATYPDLISEMNDATGLDAELIQSGLLMFDCEHKEAESWAKQWQSNLQLIDSQQVSEIDSALSASLTEEQKVLWMPDVRQVRNPRLVKVIKKYLLKQKVTFLENTQVTALNFDGNTVKGVMTTKGEYQADKVLISSGAWSANLLKNNNISVSPVKGQMILFKAKPEQIKCISLSQDRYIIPRKDGRVLVGSTIEHTKFDKSTTAEAREELIQEAYRIAPCLRNAEVEHHWAGLRPASPEGIPYICAIPEYEGLFVNAGHFRNGVVLGPASARLAADIILQRETILDASPYQLDNYKK